MAGPRPSHVWWALEGFWAGASGQCADASGALHDLGAPFPCHLTQQPEGILARSLQTCCHGAQGRDTASCFLGSSGQRVRRFHPEGALEPRGSDLGPLHPAPIRFLREGWRRGGWCSLGTSVEFWLLGGDRVLEGGFWEGRGHSQAAPSWVCAWWAGEPQPEF